MLISTSCSINHLQAGYDKDMISKLESQCKFNVQFYVENWLASSIGDDAPYNDVKLWHDLNKYCRQNPQIPNIANTEHFWYLTEECVVFSLYFGVDF